MNAEVRQMALPMPYGCEDTSSHGDRLDKLPRRGL